MKCLVAFVVLGFVAMVTDAKSLSNADFFQLSKDFVTGKT